MKKIILRSFGFLVILVIALAQFSISARAGDLQVFKNGRLMNNPGNDGDSFYVYSNGKNLHIRLYYVDCPEISNNLKSKADLIKEQTRHFGFEYSSETLRLGEEAKMFVKDVLTRPFTIHTAFEKASGKSLMGRVYAFVVTSDKMDLAALLVKNGYARVHGKGRKAPSGITRDKMFEVLRDFEGSAMLKRKGVWSKSDSDKIADYRAKQRKENKELEKIISGNDKTKDFQELFNPNTASVKELQSIKGIGPVTAKRIIAARPYQTVDDLIRVKGIGPKKLKKFRRYFTIIKK
ncbi:MAG: helix-hairpin-helix domain-containing protein [Elusimicrobiota bacterium]|nr:helix-hairpin-helix domain-containing protein [Elusimicrobiota bacterium]